MPWYAEWFDRDEYELVYQRRDEDEARQVIDLLERAVQPNDGDRILDVGCGRGRHARALARRGYAVTGLDLSERALDAARARAAEEGVDAAFVQGDMREPVCEACFDGVANLFTAFGYFHDDDDHARTVRAMAAALCPGGWLFQDFLNAPQVRATLVPRDRRATDQVEIVQRRWIADGRINKSITLRRDGNAQTFHESVRLLSRADFERYYAAAGLRLTATYGDYDGRPHTDDAPRLILVAEKG